MPKVLDRAVHSVQGRLFTPCAKILAVNPEIANTKPRDLPPIILLPFETAPEPAQLRGGGFGSATDSEYLDSRLAELRMLCFLGHDLDRWLAQCGEVVREEGSGMDGITEGSFISLLLFDPPVSVIRTISAWGIRNHQLVFSRALGLNMVYPLSPPANVLSEPFLRHFHLCADALFEVRMRTRAGAELDPRHYRFDLSASPQYLEVLRLHRS